MHGCFDWTATVTVILAADFTVVGLLRKMAMVMIAATPIRVTIVPSSYSESKCYYKITVKKERINSLNKKKRLAG